jgi:hypothetical protein
MRFGHGDVLERHTTKSDSAHGVRLTGSRQRPFGIAGTWQGVVAAIRCSRTFCFIEVGQL